MANFYLVEVNKPLRLWASQMCVLHRALRQVLLLGLVAFASLKVSVSVASTPEDAHQLVDQTIHQLMSVMAKDKARFLQDNEALLNAVDTILGDKVDFPRIARRVMAKHFKKSDKTQRQRFARLFKESLLNTYAKGLIEFEDYKVRLLPLKTTHQTTRNTQIDFEVVTSSGQVFPITQSLYFNKKRKSWMVQNVIINGVNIGQLFRDQFARLVSQQNGNISEAIDQWQASLPSAATPTNSSQESEDSADEETAEEDDDGAVHPEAA